MNDEVKDTFIKRSKIISTIRKFLDEKGFMEVPAGPMVRSSYRADKVFDKNNLGLAVPNVPASNAMQIPVKSIG